MKILACPIAAFLLGACGAGNAYAQAGTPVPNPQRADMEQCFEQSASLFDDRLSPADVVARAVAWHCEAQGNPDNYWTVPAARRSVPDVSDTFYRDLALPFVLRQRVRRLR